MPNPGKNTRPGVSLPAPVLDQRALRKVASDDRLELSPGVSVRKASLDERIARADEQRRSPWGGLARQGLDGGAAGGLESGLEHKTFRRIAGEEQFGKDDEIGALPGRFVTGAKSFGRIAGNIADSGVELGDGDSQSICGCPGHGSTCTASALRRAMAKDARGLRSL